MKSDNHPKNTNIIDSDTLISFSCAGKEEGDFIFRWDVEIDENTTRADFPHWMDGYVEIISEASNFHQKISMCILPEDLEMFQTDLLSFLNGHENALSFEPLEPYFGFNLKRRDKDISIDGYLDKGYGYYGVVTTTFDFTVSEKDLKNALSAVEKMLNKFIPLSEIDLLSVQMETSQENKGATGISKILKFLKSFFYD